MRGVCVFMGVLVCASFAVAERPMQPVVLAGFETQAGVAQWEGLAGRRTDSVASSGTYGMAFDIPKYVKENGDEPRPGLRLLHADGAGFASSDWSQWEAVVIDAWVLGDAPGKLGLKLRDSSGTDSWTTHIDVEPGLRNEALLLLADAASDIDISDVQEVVLYSLRPDHAFTLVVDALRLVPKTQIPFAKFHLMYPNYRDLIMPDAGAVSVKARVAAEDYGYELRELRLVLSLEAGEQHLVREGRFEEALWGLDIDADSFPIGPVRLCAQVMRARNRRVIAEQVWDLKKISAEERDAMAVYIDRKNNTMVEGKPFFPLGMYSGFSEQHLEEMADSPFNTLLVYGTNRRPEKEMRAYLDTVQAKGMKLVYCMNDVYPTSTYMKDHPWDGRVSGNRAICKAAVAAYRDHPALLAWYLNDEIPRSLRPHLIDYYNDVRQADPNHPTFIVLCQGKDFEHLWDTTDILAGDPYPIPKIPVARVAEMTQQSTAPTLGAQPVWLVPQAFAWYQHDADNTDRARIPSEEDLKNGRAPTREEARCMSYLGLVHGAKGLIYWCYYNMRVLPQYEEMWGWMKELGAEVEELSPVLLSNEDDGVVSVSPVTAPVHTMLKRYEGHWYLFAVNAEPEAVSVSFEVEGKLKGAVEVLFEDRQLAPEKRSFSDDFAPLAVHVYRF